jgi:S1-C subfamily serine protease
VGTSRTGTVVYYDPDRDLAVIYVPGLAAQPLPWASAPADAAASAIVLGYPLDGPFTPVSARVRETANVKGPNIYEDKNVIRQVYSLRAQVRSGNSGGPLLDAAGEVLGVIFAAALDDPETGYALTDTEVRPVADAAQSLHNAVSTGDCA